jgi:hypothetical protein
MHSYIINSINELDSVKDGWDQIYFDSATENPFLCWEWNKAWSNTFFSDGSVKIIVIFDRDEILCIAPFAIKKKKITFLADNFFADYSDIITGESTNAVIEMVVKELVQLKDWDKMSLLTIPEFSPSLEYLESVLKKTGLHTEVTCVYLNPFIDTTTEFDEYIASRSNGVRKELRRSKNKLDKTFSNWEFFEAETIDDKINVLNALIDLHLRRQGGKVGTSIFQDSAHVEFYKNLVKNKNLPWDLHLAGILVDGNFVTASISIITQDIFYYWITAFDSSVGGGSIGNLHVKFLAEKCFTQGLKRLDFMGGTEEYKMRWATDTYKNFEIVTYRSTVRLYRDKVWSFVRRYLQKLKDRQPLINRFWTVFSKLVGK